MGIKNKKMSEGRKTQIVLLDERRLEMLIQPKLYAGELLDLVASHFSLKEKEYFGLCFKDETSTKQSKDRKSSFPSFEQINSGHYHWLQLDRKVLEHDFPKKTGPLVVFFAVRFFIESITYLRDNSTIELFYLQAKHSIFKDQLECDSDIVFELAAHVLQATYSDYTEDDTAKEHIKKLPILPTSALKEHPSISYCEEEVINYYKKLAGQSRGSAIVNYMTIVEALPTYGIHYYEVKDKSGIPWWLGLSYKGIAQYDYNDRKVPRQVFAWKQLENLYFRDKKFSIEVHDPKRIVHTLSSFNLYEDAIQEPIEEFDDLSDAISDPTTQVSVSRRTFGPGNVNVHAWFASTPALTKCIWSMAVSQHQFYLDRKQSKLGFKTHLPSVRSMSEIAADLCQSTSSLPSSASGSISRSNSAHSLTMSLSTNNTKLEYSAEEIEANQAAERDMYAALKARKEALEDALRKKTEELKALCLKESELTGELPPEFPLIAGEIVPQVRRRVGTAFTLSPKIINRDKASQEEELLAKYELEFEIQDKITKAARRLAEDISVAKGVRKQRRQTYHKAHQKLKDLEQRVNEARRMCGRVPVKAPSVEGTVITRKPPISGAARQKRTQSLSVPAPIFDLVEDGAGDLDSEPEFVSPMNSPALQQRNAAMRDQQPQVQVIPSPRVEVVEFEHPASPSMGRPLTPSSQGSGLPRSGSPVSPSLHHQGAAPGFSRGSTPSPNPQRPLTGGYTPNALYQTRTQYRMQNYPTFTTRSHSSSSTQSEYDNLNGTNRHIAGPPPHPSSSSSSSHLPSSHLHYNNNPNEAIHNFYNVNTHQMAHYNSADELGKSSSSDDLLNEMREQERQNQVWLPSKHGSLEGAYRKRNQSGDGHVQRYMSSHGHHHHGEGFIIPHLTPSRFGSKRESTADYRDSMYPSEEYTLYNMDDRSQSGSSNRDDYDFPPPPPPHELNHWGEEGQPLQHQPGYYNQMHGFNPTSVRDQAVLESDNGVPYMDSPHGNSQQYSNESTDSVKQQPPPHTPKTEVPPQSFIQDSPYDSSNALSPSMDSPQQVMTVTKYQSYVEVSKPFEMSDFYKYSEKLRKQRTINSRQQKLEAVLSGQPIPKSQEGPPPVPVRYNSYISSTPGGSSPGPLSPVSSAYGSPARPSSPFNSSSQGSQRSSRPSSPYTGGHISPPSPRNYQNVHQSVRTRGPYAVQSNLVQTQYHAQSMAYQQGGNQQQSTNPAAQHLPYQAPKPMTCEPLRSAANKTPTQYNRFVNDSMGYYDDHSGSVHYSDNSHNNSSFYSDHTPGHSYYEEHSMPVSNNLSSFDMSDVAHAFSEEMLAWYDDQDQHKPSTLV